MITFVYDAAVLFSADRNERRTWAEHKARLEMGFIPLVPAPVVAQVSRSHRQVQLRRLLAGCEVVPMRESDAHEAGLLLGKTQTTDIVDAAVTVIALQHESAVILTADRADIRRLIAASGGRTAEAVDP